MPISVYASPTLLASLYDGAVKVIATGPESLPGGLPCRLLQAGPDATGEGMCLSDAASATDDAAVRPVEVCPVEVPPAHVWALWAGEQATGLHRAERLLAWWRAAGGVHGVPALWTGSAAELERRLLDSALDSVAELHGRNQDLQRTLSSLRNEWAHGARVPPEVTELLENLRLSPSRMIFAAPPCLGDRAVPALPSRQPAGAASPAGAVLVQRLPVWARGFAGIDLHVAFPGSGGGALLASVHAVDSGQVLADWQVPFADLRPGWLPLRLPEASCRPWRVLELRVCCFTAGGLPPALSLAPTGLLEEFALRIDPGSAAPADASMLALRLWGGLPGVAYGPAPHLIAHPLAGPVILPLPDHVVAQIRRSRDHQASFPWFGYLQKGRVLLHPLRGKVAAARMPLRAVPALAGIVCEVAVEDRRFHTMVACKLVAAPPEVTVDQAEREEGILASSGWMTIDAPLSAHLLTARLHEPWHKPLHLHLFSIIGDGGYGLYGRAIFSGFRIEIQGRDAWSMPPVPAACDEAAAD